MEPSSKSTSGIELPLPAMEPLPPTSNNRENVPLGSRPEASPAYAESLPTPKLPSAGSSIPTIPLPMSQASPVTPIDPATSNSVSTTPVASPIVDDGDLIEKAWVDKAKQIVERTRDDPHKQSEAITVFKADYMKKRYGKTIKLSQ